MQDWRRRAFEPDREQEAVGGEKAMRLAELRDQLQAAQRVAAKYPELAESSGRKARAIMQQISELET